MRTADARTDKHLLGLILTGRMQELNGPSFSAADWGRLVAAAEAEDVAPSVYWTLSTSGQLESIPEPCSDSLREGYSTSLLHHLTLFKKLDQVAEEFNQAGIPVVALKGVCYAVTIYPDIGLRPMTDIDLLVPVSRLADAATIAKSLGFAETAPEASPGLNELLSHHVCLESPGPDSIALEIHHTLLGDEVFSFSVPVDWFWSQTDFLKDHSNQKFKSLRMLTPVAQLLYAAAHAMLQHGGRRAPLRWFHDLHLLIRHYDGRIDWDLLLSQAKQFEWSSAVDAALARTHEYFDTPIPDRVRRSLSETPDRHRALVALRQEKAATHVIEEQQKLMTLNWHGRARLALALIAPSPSYMVWRYELKSKWAVPVYYLVRWWGILKDGVRTLKASIGR